MNGIHLSGVDLNLFLTLSILVEEASVTRAAARLHVTPSAVSHSLGRLRELCDDPLLVRLGRGLTPTDRAKQIAERARAALDALALSLAPTGPFDAARSSRRFTVALSDYGGFVLLPRVAHALDQRAPGIDLVVVPLTERSVDDLSEGELDLCIGAQDARGAAIRSRVLFRDRFVCLVRRGHPAAGQKLSLEAFLALRHLRVAPHQAAPGYVDEVLARRGLSRRVVMRVPHFLVAPQVVAESDLVSTLAERVAVHFERTLPVRRAFPPSIVGAFSLSMAWHERAEHDAGHAFLRALIVEVAGAAATPGKKRRRGPKETTDVA